MRRKYRRLLAKIIRWALWLPFWLRPRCWLSSLRDTPHGCGIHDDTERVQRAIDRAALSKPDAHGYVYARFGRGTFLCRRTVRIDAPTVVKGDPTT